MVFRPNLRLLNKAVTYTVSLSVPMGKLLPQGAAIQILQYGCGTSMDLDFYALW